MSSISPKDRIIFALDVASVDEASRFTSLLKDHIGMFKIGLELFVACGPAAIKAVRDNGGKGIFLDLKFHDIPETVKGAMKSASTLGADLVTVGYGESKLKDPGQPLAEANRRVQVVNMANKTTASKQ